MLSLLTNGQTMIDLPWYRRMTWWAYRLDYVEKGVPLWKALLRYKASEDREEAWATWHTRDEPYPEYHSLVSSNVQDRVHPNDDGFYKWKNTRKHMPIIDLDVPHEYVQTSYDAEKGIQHAHLYLNTPISRWRWWALMVGLYVSGNIEKGFFWWSLRRGGNFVRPKGVKKPEMPQAEAQVLVDQLYDEWVMATAIGKKLNIDSREVSIEYVKDKIVVTVRLPEGGLGDFGAHDRVVSTLQEMGVWRPKEVIITRGEL